MGQDIQTRLLRYLEENKSKVQFLSEIAENLDLPQSSIKNAMYKIKGKHPHALAVVHRGQAWLWQGLNVSEKVETVNAVSAYPPELQKVSASVTDEPTGPDPRLFDEIGTAKDGSIIIADASGVLYRATEL